MGGLVGRRDDVRGLLSKLAAVSCKVMLGVKEREVEVLRCLGDKRKKKGRLVRNATQVGASACVHVRLQCPTRIPISTSRVVCPPCGDGQQGAQGARKNEEGRRKSCSCAPPKKNHETLLWLSPALPLGSCSFFGTIIRDRHVR